MSWIRYDLPQANDIHISFVRRSQQVLNNPLSPRERHYSPPGVTRFWQTDNQLTALTKHRHEDIKHLAVQSDESCVILNSVEAIRRVGNDYVDGIWIRQIRDVHLFDDHCASARC